MQIMLMLGLVVFTGFYAWSTSEQAEAGKKMAEETREATLASQQPIIVMGRAPGEGVISDTRQITEQTTIEHGTWLYNVGPGPALNLHFFLKEPNRNNASGTFSGKGLSALASGEAYLLIIQTAFGQKMLSSHDLVVEYEDVFGGKWRSGLELNYTSGQDRYTVIRLFHEKMS